MYVSVLLLVYEDESKYPSRIRSFLLYCRLNTDDHFLYVSLYDDQEFYIYHFFSGDAEQI